MSCFFRYGAPARAIGGLRVSMVTLSIRPSAAARTASRPSRAPVGTTMRAPVLPASSKRCMRGNRAPTEAGMKMRPASKAGTAIRSKIEAGAHSTTMSASASACRSTRRGEDRKPARLARALTSSRQDTAINRNPSTPASSARARGKPIAPRPAIATVLFMPPSSLRCLREGPAPTASIILTRDAGSSPRRNQHRIYRSLGKRRQHRPVFGHGWGEQRDSNP